MGRGDKHEREREGSVTSDKVLRKCGRRGACGMTEVTQLRRQKGHRGAGRWAGNVAALRTVIDADGGGWERNGKKGEAWAHIDTKETVWRGRRVRWDRP